MYDGKDAVGVGERGLILGDIQQNKIVALYFACSDGPDRVGEVVVFKNMGRRIANYPIINAIADSYRFADATET